MPAPEALIATCRYVRLALRKVVFGDDPFELRLVWPWTYYRSCRSLK